MTVYVFTTKNGSAVCYTPHSLCDRDPKTEKFACEIQAHVVPTVETLSGPKRPVCKGGIPAIGEAFACNGSSFLLLRDA